MSLVMKTTFYPLFIKFSLEDRFDNSWWTPVTEALLWITNVGT